MSTTLRADTGSLSEAGRLTDAQVDVTCPQTVQFVVREDGKTVWVNVNGICVFRACQIGHLEVQDGRRQK